MNGIILLVHAPLASAMLDCVSHIYGYVPDNILAVNVHGDDTQQSIHKSIKLWIEEKRYDGYVILNDLHGASPFNMGKAFIEKYQFNFSNHIHAVLPIIMLTGLSLPMLMKSICHQNLPVNEMAIRSLEGVLQCSSMLKKQLVDDAISGSVGIPDEKLTNTTVSGKYVMASIAKTCK
jgi:PTS system ascorbate-specific IIA component